MATLIAELGHRRRNPPRRALPTRDGPQRLLTLKRAMLLRAEPGAGARAAPDLVVEVEVNGKMQELRASPHDDPRRAAHAFCIKHNLTVSVENMACGEMLAEELVEKGARYPLPSEKLLRVRGGVVPAGPWRDRAQQLVPPHCA